MRAPKPPFKTLKAKGFDVIFVSHAAGILAQDFPQAIAELEHALSDLELPITEIIGSGGGETKFTQRLRKTLAAMNWKKHEFKITKTVDNVPMESTSHEVDHVRRFEGIGVIAMEIEEASAKVRIGGPVDDADDMSWPVWAGVVPVTLTPGAPIDDARAAPMRPPSDVVTGWRKPC